MSEVSNILNKFNGGAQYTQPQNNNQQQPQREKISLKIEPQPFDGELKSKTTTTLELSKQIYSLFKGIFYDFEGAMVVPNNYGNLEVLLYFKERPVMGDNTDGKLLALEPAMSDPRSLAQAPASDRIRMFNTRNLGRVYNLTEDAKDILEDFMNTQKGKKPNWNQIAIEKPESQYNTYSVIMQISGLDINKLIKTIYGNTIDKDGKKARVDYSVSLLRAVGINYSGIANNFLISIQQLDGKEVEKIAAKAGMIPSNGTIPMYRG